MDKKLEDNLKSIYFGVCGLYIDQDKHMARIVVGYPNKQFGVFEMPTRNGLPKLDTTPRFIYHSAPAKMIGRPLGYVVKDLDEINPDFLESIRDSIVKFLAARDKIDSCYLDPKPYVFFVLGYGRPNGPRGGSNQRWLVSFCDGFSFINAEFRTKIPRSPDTPWTLEHIYTVMDFDNLYSSDFEYIIQRCTDIFKRQCVQDGYYELQKPYGPIPLYVEEALKNWQPQYQEVEFPESLKFYEPIFVPGMTYNALPLTLVDLDEIDLDEKGNVVHYVALMDDKQTLHRFPNWKLGLDSSLKFERSKQ